MKTLGILSMAALFALGCEKDRTEQAQERAEERAEMTAESAEKQAEATKEGAEQKVEAVEKQAEAMKEGAEKRQEATEKRAEQMVEGAEQRAEQVGEQAEKRAEAIEETAEQKAEREKAAIEQRAKEGQPPGGPAFEALPVIGDFARTDRDRQVARDIRSSFQADSTLRESASDVKISAVDCKITLTGTVDSRAEHRAFIAKAKASSGGCQVIDRLEVE